MTRSMQRRLKNFLWGHRTLSPLRLLGSKLRMSLLVITLLGLTYLLLKSSTLGLILALLLWTLFFYLGYIILTYSI